MKLGLKPPMELLVVDAPPEYAEWLGELPPGVTLVSPVDGEVQAAHVFVSERAVLEELLHGLRRQLHSTGRSRCRSGFVDSEVCAVSDVWSGLKLVIRKEEREA